MRCPLCLGNISNAYKCLFRILKSSFNAPWIMGARTKNEIGIWNRNSRKEKRRGSLNIIGRPGSGNSWFGPTFGCHVAPHALPTSAKSLRVAFSNSIEGLWNKYSERKSRLTPCRRPASDARFWSAMAISPTIHLTWVGAQQRQSTMPWQKLPDHHPNTVRTRSSFRCALHDLAKAMSAKIVGLVQSRSKCF